MNPDIKPIETKYRGYKFRSRLEARWAVFLHHYGVDFEYEPEGFRMPSGRQYLPDFLLTKQKVFVEIKPTKDLGDEDVKKMVEFAADCDHQLLLIIGSPTKEEMFLVSRRSMMPLTELEQFLEEGETIHDAFFETLSDAVVRLAPLPTHPSSEIFVVYKDLPPFDDHKRMQSLLAAKQSRFEFGDSKTA